MSTEKDLKYNIKDIKIIRVVGLQLHLKKKKACGVFTYMHAGI